METLKPASLSNFSEGLEKNSTEIDSILIGVANRFKKSLDLEVTNVSIELERINSSWELLIKFKANKSIYQIILKISLELGSHQSTVIVIDASAILGSETPVGPNEIIKIIPLNELAETVIKKINNTLREVAYFEFTNKKVRVNLLAQQ